MGEPVAVVQELPELRDRGSPCLGQIGPRVEHVLEHDPPALALLTPQLSSLAPKGNRGASAYSRPEVDLNDRFSGRYNRKVCALLDLVSQDPQRILEVIVGVPEEAAAGILGWRPRAPGAQQEVDLMFERRVCLVR